MTSITFKTADALILPQVKRFFRAQGFRAQAPRNDHIVIALSQQRIIAALRFSPLDTHWLLRSMCVDENHRGLGIGTQLMQHCSNWMLQHDCYCFSFNQVQNFYCRAGFVVIDPDCVATPVAEKFNSYLAQGKQLVLMKYHP